MRKFVAFISISLFMLTGTVRAQFGVNNVAVNPAFPNPCDSITFTVTGDHDQANITNSWLTDTLVNDTIFLTVHAVIPPMSVGGLTAFSYTTTLAPLPLDTYIIRATYVASIPTFPPNSVTDTLYIDTLINVDAGQDTSFCNGNLIQLNAIPPPGSLTGSWSVIQGNATLNSSTIYDPIVSNLSFGDNIFVWNIPGSTCASGGSDTVVLFNSPEPSPAITMPDTFSCVDSVEITASFVQHGVAGWQVLSGSSMINNPNDSVSWVHDLSTGNNKFQWTIVDTNGLCPTKSDELEVDYRTANAVTIIRVGDTLLAGTAPNYQWFRDNTAIPGANSNKLHVTVNGIYKVQTNADGCDNGPYSNEVEVSDMVGIHETGKLNASVYPNPSSGQWRLTFKEVQNKAHIRVYNLAGELIMEKMVYGDRTVLLDINAPAGIYQLQCTGDQATGNWKLIKNNLQ